MLIVIGYSGKTTQDNQNNKTITSTTSNIIKTRPYYDFSCSCRSSLQNFVGHLEK